MSPNEPKPATPEAQALLRAAGRDWKTIEITLTDINTVAETMEHVHAWVERQIYE